MGKRDEMKKIMFLFHSKEREYGIIMMIKEQIQAIEPTCEIRIGEFYSSITETIEFMPNVIVSIPPRDVFSSNYLTMLKLFTGAVVISMNTEGYYLFTPEEKKCVVGYNTYSKELVDYFFMWGGKTKRELGKSLLVDKKITDTRRIKVIGYANYELNKVKRYNERNYQYDKINQWLEKFEKCLLVITGFVVADISVKNYHELGYFGDDKAFECRTEEELEQAKKSILGECEFRKKYIDKVIMLAEKNPNMGIIVKLHPIEVSDRIRFYNFLDQYKNIYLIQEEMPLGMLLPKVIGMIHYNSTCNLEAYIYNIPTIQLYEEVRRTSYSFTWQNKGESTYLVSIEDDETLQNIIENGLIYKRNAKLEKLLYEQFNWKRGRAYKPIEKTAHYILQAKKKQRLKISDIEVKKAVESEQGKKVIKSIQYELIKKLNSNKNFINEIVQLVKIYMYIYLSK